MRRRLSFLSCLLGLAFGDAHARAQTGELSPGVRAALEAGVESAELRAMREAEARMFATESDHAPSGPTITATGDVAFLAGAALPDMPARWDDAVVRYLEFFRDDPRGRALMRAWYQRGHRYDQTIRTTLRENGVPEDLRCVALAESGFDPTVRSPVGALGMWQFMPDSGRQYGMARDRWVDERMDPERATRGAARYLRDLQRRFGSWELALAAYNMGYGALLRAIRKYNTNDFAVLARVEAGLPFETSVYVSKIVACGVVLRNPERFGLGDVMRDTPLATATVSVPGGTPLAEVARLAGVQEDDVARLNPHLLLRLVPPNRPAYDVKLPLAARTAYETAVARTPRWSHRTTTMRVGERPAEVAARFGITEEALLRLNRFAASERLVGPLALAVPNVEPRGQPAPRPHATRPTVPVPALPNSVPNRVRVFYAVVDGDELDELASFFEVETDELARWNSIDPIARLQSGMMLQIFAPTSVDLAEAVVLREDAVRLVVAGTDEFFDWHETQRGRVRMRYRVETGDTLGGVAARFGLTLGDIARINHMPRNGLLRVGQELVVYTSRDVAPTDSAPSDGALPAPPATSRVTSPAASPDTTDTLAPATP